MTVRELIELQSREIRADVNAVGQKVVELSADVADLKVRVARLQTGDERDAKYEGRSDVDRQARHQQMIAIVGIAFSIIISVANMTALLVISHG